MIYRHWLEVVPNNRYRIRYFKIPLMVGEGLAIGNLILDLLGATSLEQLKTNQRRDEWR